MKFLKILTISVISTITILFSGCSVKMKEAEVITKIEQVQKICPSPLTKPQFIPYETQIIEIDGKVYYAVSREDGLILSSNWISYKNWAETNYKLMSESQCSK